MSASRIAGLAVAVAAVAAAPFTTACYEPRIETCRGPIADFRSFTDVALVDPIVPSGGAEQAVPALAYTVRASTTSRVSCVQVHSELSGADGALLEVIDTPVRARVVGGVLTTTPFFHYRFGAFPERLVVTVLGTTLTATIPRPGTVLDAGSSDGGSPRGDAGP